MQSARPEIVLASGSATRRMLLAAAGLRFRTESPAVDEAAIKQSARGADMAAEEAALSLAALKAARIRDADALVIGADQILLCENEWFDKPADLATAREQLLALRGRTHELVTAVVCRRGGTPVWQYLARPRLAMRHFSDAFLDAYLAAEGTDILASVGAYRLEAGGIQLFERVEGEHAAILGLPLLPLLGFLRQHGVLLG